MVSEAVDYEVFEARYDSPDSSFHKKIDPSWWAEFPPYKEEPAENFIIDLRRGAGATGSKEEIGSPKTPLGPRRKLTFGSNLSPAIAGLRATPTMTPTKRALEKDASTETGTPPKRQLIIKERVAGVRGIGSKVDGEVDTKVEKLNVINRLMGAKPRSFSSPATCRRKRNKHVIDGDKICIKQRSITSMLSSRSSECIRSYVENTEGGNDDAKEVFGGGSVAGLKHAGEVLKEMKDGKVKGKDSLN